MRKWALGVAVALAGLSLIALAAIPGLFGVAPRFNDLTSNFKPAMTASNIAELRADLGGLTAAQAQFVNQAVPGLAQQLHMTPAQLSSTLAQQFPATMAGMQAVPATSAQFTQVLNLLDSQIGNFQQADSIPAGSIPPTVIPWVLLVVGLVLLLVAAFLRRWWRAGLAVVIGAVMVIVPFTMSLPGKALAADAMNTALKPVYTAQLVSGAQQSRHTMSAMGTELQTKMLPALGQMLNMPAAQVESFLGTNFPALGSALQNFPTSIRQFDDLVGTFDRSLTDYNDIKSTEFTPIVWTMLAVGGFVLLAGLIEMLDLARRRSTGRRIVAERPLAAAGASRGGPG